MKSVLWEPRRAGCTIMTAPDEVSTLRMYIKFNKRDKCILVADFSRPLV